MTYASNQIRPIVAVKPSAGINARIDRVLPILAIAAPLGNLYRVNPQDAFGHVD
jgi:hypothetical protein